MNRAPRTSEGAVESGLFRKRPVVVRAYRFAGPDPMVIRTLEGEMTAQPGDWIITGVAGEAYACRDDIFPRNLRGHLKT